MMIYSHFMTISYSYDNQTIIISSLQCAGDCPSDYFNEIVSFKDWCERHHLVLNTNKTKEMIFDPRPLSQPQNHVDFL